MINLTYNTLTGTVALAQPAILKPGHGVPVTLTFSAAPGTVNGLQLALVDDAVPRNLQAFLDVSGWTSGNNSTVYTGTLDVSGALITYMAGKNSATLNLQLTVQINGATIDLPDLPVTVQPQGIPGSPSNAPGELFYTQGQVDALVAPLAPAVNQAEIDVNAGVSSAPLFTATNFALIACKIVAAAGADAYTANYTLPTANVVTGAIAEVNIELPNSGNPAINLYSFTASGAPLSTITNSQPGGAAYWYGRFRFDGTAWHTLFRAFQV
ncbi:MAG: hypothetical protein P4L00_09390 [Candidatus Acidoferrales bacterium]|nr:hypothetical protein [Candidatus Acidoferrales bacterium]